MIDDHTVGVGSGAYLPELGVPADELRAAALITGRGSGEAHVNVSVDGHVGGVIVMADEVRPDAPEAVERLRDEGIRHVAMASGDRRSVAERMGRELALDCVYAELSPGMGLSLAAMIVAAFGYLPPVASALLQAGVDLTVILNALRARRG